MKINKSIIVKSLNIIIILFAFSIILYTQKYTTLIQHAYIYPWFEELRGRFPAYCYEFLFNNFLPNIFNANPNDFRSGFGFGCILITILYLLINFVFSAAFFISLKEKWKLLSRKEFGVIFLISLFLISIPFGQENPYYLNYIRVDDIATVGEYFFSYIPFFGFLIFLFLSVTDSKIFSIKNPLCIIGIIFSFMIGAYNEVFNLTSLFCTLIFILFISIFDKECVKGKKEQILFPVIPLFLGLIHYYVICNNFFEIGIVQYNTTFMETIQNGIISIKEFSYTYFQVLLKAKLMYFIIILILSTMILSKKDKQKNLCVFFSISIIVGYLFTNFLMVFVTGISSSMEQFLFQRDIINTAYANILQFSVLVLFGNIYYSYPKQKYLFLLMLVSSGVLFVNLFNKVESINIEKFETKQLVYTIDKYNLIYSLFGETTVLPESFIEKTPIKSDMVLKFRLEYLPSTPQDYKSHVKDRYFDSFYFLYGNFFRNIYEKEFIGVVYKQDDIANEELNKRLELLDEKMETSEELRENNISFKTLNAKYKGRQFSSKELLEIQDKKGKQPILTKAIAYSFYKENNISEALKYYNEYLKINPYDFDALSNLANIFIERKEYENAEAMLLKLYQIDLKNITTLYKLTNLYFYNLNNKDKSIYYCNKMIELKPDLYLLYINKAIIFSTFEDYENAKEELETARNIFKLGTDDVLQDLNIKTLKKLKLFLPRHF